MARVDQAHLDPVCGMDVGADTPYRAVHGGREYRFCSASCLDEFQRSPNKYVTAPRESRPARG